MKKLLPFPERKFGTIVLDPPWRFGNTVTRAAAANHYPTMSSADLMCMPLESRAKTNAHMYLWTTAAHIVDALDLMANWGFTYKLNLVWVKCRPQELRPTLPYKHGKAVAPWWPPRVQIGLGNYFRHAHELCLFGVRGKCPARVHNLSTIIFAPRGKHSAKPVELYERAEALSPGPRLELFARSARKGWDRWGLEAHNEVDSKTEDVVGTTRAQIAARRSRVSASDAKMRRLRKASA